MEGGRRALEEGRVGHMGWLEGGLQEGVAGRRIKTKGRGLGVWCPSSWGISSESAGQPVACPLQIK